MTKVLTPCASATQVIAVATPRREATVRREVAFPIGLLVASTAYITVTGSSYAVFVYCTALLASLGALALGVLMGTAGQISIGNAAFLAIGGYTSVFLERSGLDFPWSVSASAAVAALIGLVVGLPALRIRGLYLALATLAAHFVIVYVADEYQTEAVGSSGFLLSPVFVSQGIDRQQQLWAWMLCAIVIVVLCAVACLKRAKVGRALEFTKLHEHVAPTLGIDTGRFKLMVFCLSSGLVGLQGALVPHFTGSLSIETFTLALGISFIAMIMIGGVGKLIGPVLGAFIVTILPTQIPAILRDLVGGGRAAIYAPHVAGIIYGILILLAITRSADGLSGWLADRWAATQRRVASRVGTSSLQLNGQEK